jgi:hypothetical protein
MLLLNADLAYMVGMASLHSHNEADVEGGSETLTTMYYDALAHMPYITQGKTGKDMANENREAAIERYRDMKRRTLKEPEK